MPKRPKVATQLLGSVLKKYDGDYQKTADHLGVRKLYVRDRVLKDAKLRAIWVENGTSNDIPDEIDVLAREEDPGEKNERMLKQLKKNGRDQFENDIKSMLSHPGSAEKLDVFKHFDDSVGMLMAESLRVTQKLNIRQNLALFEVAEQLRDSLQDPDMDMEEHAQKTRLFIQACEQQGKFHDRLLKGLEFQLKLYDQKEKGEARQKKAGFQPLRDFKRLQEEENVKEAKTQSSS
jgi:hypothetical protein